MNALLHSQYVVEEKESLLFSYHHWDECFHLTLNLLKIFSKILSWCMGVYIYIVNFSWPKGCSEALCQPVTCDSVYTILFSMSRGKALGSEGYLVAFFKSTWSVVGQDWWCNLAFSFLYFLPSLLLWMRRLSPWFLNVLILEALEPLCMALPFR